MASYNRVFLIGNLTRDPELLHTPDGKPIGEFTVAVNGAPREDGESSADFIPITVWGKSGEACAKHLKKGSLVHVDGRIKHERWEKDGEKRSRLAIVANVVTFLSGTKKGDGVALQDEPAEAAAPTPA
jgi:single-strand DNA-binding protein